MNAIYVRKQIETNKVIMTKFMVLVINIRVIIIVVSCCVNITKIIT